MDKRFAIIVTAIIVGFFAVVILNKKETPADKTSSAAASTGSQHFYGKADSKVTVTEFVDFQCEACYAYYPHVKQVKELYKDRVRFQIRNFPIESGHQFARQAARSAEAASKQGKFWEMHDKLFEGQKMWERATDPQVYFDTYAKDLGLNMQQFETDRKSDEVNAIISKDLRDVQELGGTGTPTFVINGKLTESPGADVDKLSKMIDDALKEAGV